VAASSMERLVTVVTSCALKPSASHDLDSALEEVQKGQETLIYLRSASPSSHYTSTSSRNNAENFCRRLRPYLVFHIQHPKLHIQNEIFHSCLGHYILLCFGSGCRICECIPHWCRCPRRRKLCPRRNSMRPWFPMLRYQFWSSNPLRQFSSCLHKRSAMRFQYVQSPTRPMQWISFNILGIAFSHCDTNTNWRVLWCTIADDYCSCGILTTRR
jgi:hypothetical protein